MAVKRPAPFRRPSSRYLDRLLLSLRSRSSHAAGVLPRRHHQYPAGDKDDGAVARRSRSRRRLVTPSSFSDEEPPPPSEPPPLKLSHPLLRLLESAGGTAASPRFLQILAQLLVSGLVRHPLAAGRVIKFLCSSSSSSSSSLPAAVALFSAVDAPDAFLSNTILRSYLASGRPGDAFDFFRRRAPLSLVTPNHFTFPLLAKLVADLGHAWEGRSIHSLAVRSGFQTDLCVRNSLIHMYSSFGDVGAARSLFDLDLDSDLVTWNSMINGYVKNGMVHSARVLFDEMPERDLVSWNTMIAGHAQDGDMEAAKELFLKMPKKDVVSWNSLVDGYAKKGEVATAREVFNKMPVRNLISWNVMLALYARSKDYKECLRLFDAMIATGEVEPDEATFVSVLTACANLGELERGKWVHSLMKDNDMMIVPDVLLYTTLLTMYAKCGAMELAREVFETMEERNIVSWNSMIMGYGLHGYGDKAVELFMEMEKSGMRPNETTFVCVLSACAHGGMVLEGWWFFDRMTRVYGFEPKEDHFGCMMDVLGRAGLLRDLQELIKKMPDKLSPASLGALLSACIAHSDCELGEFVGKKLIEKEPRDIGPYVLLSNIYAAKGKWDDVEKIREMMKDNGLQKTAGTSNVDANRCTSVYHLQEHISVSRRDMVYSMLTEMGGHVKLTCSAM